MANRSEPASSRSVLQSRNRWRGQRTIVFGCRHREVTGYEFAWRVSQAKEAERAVDSVCLARFGTLRPESQRR
jgi:hypothetical protein